MQLAHWQQALQVQLQMLQWTLAMVQEGVLFSDPCQTVCQTAGQSWQ
jgi:hypothetical protein